MIIVSAVIVVLLLPCLPGTLAAQQISGGIEGSVQDPQGAVIPGVKITATHVDTGSVYETQTSDIGQFAIPNVRLGTYHIAAEVEGFKRAVVEGVRVEVGGAASVLIPMEIGTTAEFQITVSAELAQMTINTVDAEISTVVDNRRVLELPLNGRNAVELAMQQAGVVFERSPDGQGDKLFVNGQRHRAIQMTLDGVDTQDNFTKSSATMVDQPLLPMAAENVQEFRVVTGLASAEYSRGGSHISAVTRSGTNEFHGSVFWFNRNDFFGANEFFNNSAQPAVETPPLNRNQFGGRLGGPVVKNRFFFYAGYQQTREARGTPVNRLVYTPEARQGVFRFLDGIRNTPESVAANPGKIRTVNLLQCGGEVAGVLKRDCVDGRFDLANPATLDPFINGTVLGIIPPPNNFDIGDGLNTGGFRFNSRSLTIEHLPAMRFDYQVNAANQIYATFNYVDREIQGDYINSREPPYPAQEPLGSRLTHSRGFSVGWTSTVRPTLVNEARFGLLGGENAFVVTQPFGQPFSLFINTIYSPYDAGNNTDVRDLRTVHLRNVTSWLKGNHQVKFGAEWRQRWAETYSLDRLDPWGVIGLDDNDNPPDFSTGDLTKIAGAKSINSNDGETGRDLMNNLVGAISDINTRFNVRSLTSGFLVGQEERRIYQNNEFDLFVNDTWRVAPSLTLNLGLRWEYASVPNEQQGLALTPAGGLRAAYGISGPSGFFNPGQFNGAPCNALGRLPMAPTTANAVSFVEDCATRYYPATAANGRPLWEDDWNNFAPVVSLAWDPAGDGKTSIRTGFRISYMQDHFEIVDGNLDDNEGLRVDDECIPSAGGCTANPRLLRDVTGPALPPTPEFRLPSVRSILDNSTIDFRAFDESLGTPYYNEWTFSVSREIGKNWALEARYLGSRGIGLRRVADFNEINVRATDPVTGQTFLDAFVKAQQNLACNRSSGAGSRFDDLSGAACVVPNPLMAALIAGEPARLRTASGLITAIEDNATGQFAHRLTQVETSRPAAGQDRIRGGSFWGQVLQGRFPANYFMADPFVASARAMVNDGFSSYHALQLELRRRLARGLALQANYTYGKALADFDGDENTLINDTRASSVINPRYSKGEFLPRHQVNTNWIWELPFGAGKKHLTGGLGARVFGGWQVTGLFSLRSGLPLSITSNVGTFHRGAISDDNTVSLPTGITAGEIRALAGRRDFAAGVFWLDPCMSAFNNIECAGADAVQGAFGLPRPGELGELGQTPFFGPGRVLLDMGLAKRTRVRERYDVEFRWEVFNVLNHANFANPVTNITSASFGQISRTVSAPRLMQFALKVNF